MKKIAAFIIVGFLLSIHSVYAGGNRYTDVIVHATFQSICVPEGFDASNLTLGVSVIMNDHNILTSSPSIIFGDKTNPTAGYCKYKKDLAGYNFDFRVAMYDYYPIDDFEKKISKATTLRFFNNDGSTQWPWNVPTNVKDVFIIHKDFLLSYPDLCGANETCYTIQKIISDSPTITITAPFGKIKLKLTSDGKEDYYEITHPMFGEGKRVDLKKEKS